METGQGRRSVYARAGVVAAAAVLYAVNGLLATAPKASARPYAGKPAAAFGAAVARATGIADTGTVTRSACGFSPDVSSYSLGRSRIVSTARCLRDAGALDPADLVALERDTGFSVERIDCPKPSTSGAAGVCSFSESSRVDGSRSWVSIVLLLAGLVAIVWLFAVRLPLRAAAILVGLALLADAIVLIAGV